MTLFRRTCFTLCASVTFSPLLLAQQQASPTPFQQRIAAAMQSDIRTPEERARDVNRLPVEILSFFRLRDDMRVIEILPACGWFTKLQGPAL
jgi:predicted methyltransferase